MLDEHAADNGSDDRYAAQCERIDERGVRGGLDHQRAQKHRRDESHGKGFEEVRRHAGAVPHVVADIVGDHRGIARVILGNARFHLADQVRADIGALGEDAAAKPREDRDERPAETETHQRLDDIAGRRTGRRRTRHDRVVTRDAEQAQADDEEARDRAPTEGERQRFIQAHPGGLRGTHVGANRDIHSDISGRPRQDRTNREAPGGGPTETRNESDDQEQDHADNADMAPV